MLLSESNRVERVTRLTYLLVTRGEVCVDEAADVFTTTPRTIRRDLAEMSRVIEIYNEDKHYYYLSQSETISPY